MRKFLQKAAELYSRAVRSNWLLAVISVVLGTAMWIYMINTSGTIRTTEYQKVPVKIELAGTVPERYGLYMMQDGTLHTVNVEVEGSRAKMMNFSREDLTVSLDLSPVTTPGGYNLDVKVRSKDSDVTVVSVEPATIYFEFDDLVTKAFPIKFNYTGTLTDGYVLTKEIAQPAEIEISGPASIVNTIGNISIPVNINGAKNPISGTQILNLQTTENQTVERTYLTVSAEEIQYEIGIAYQKTVPVEVLLANRYGGDESNYLIMQYTPESVMIQGSEKDLMGVNKISIGEVPTETIAGTKQTFSMALPQNPLYTYADTSLAEIAVEVSLDQNASVRNYTFEGSYISNISLLNIPEGKTARITDTSFTLPIRSLNYVFDNIDINDISLSVDLSKPNADGKYPISVQIPSVPFGVMKQIYVSVEIN